MREQPVGSSRPMRVLHVAEALGGGVSTAVEAYVSLTRDLDHVVLAHRRAPYYVRSWLEDEIPWVSLPPSGRLAQLAAVHRAVREWRPDVIHAHSSWAGVLVRLQPTVPTATVVFTPHCFAFERTDVGRGTAAVFRLAERLLARRSGHVLANGAREARLASGLGPPARVSSLLVTPWSAAGPREHVPTPAPRARATGPLAVVAVGRLQPQKGVDFFLDLVRSAEAAAPGMFRWRWLGSGDAREERLCHEAGVSVSGWLARDAVLEELNGSDVYLHTAAWEAGYPLSLLEAVQCGLPVVARDIPPLEGLPVRKASTPGGAAGLLVDLLDADDYRQACASSLSLLATLREVDPGEHLRRVYAAASTSQARRGKGAA